MESSSGRTIRLVRSHVWVLLAGLFVALKCQERLGQDEWRGDALCCALASSADNLGVVRLLHRRMSLSRHV